MKNPDPSEFVNPTDQEVTELLRRVRRIAVVGLSPKPHRDSHRVAQYLQQRGYEIVPVYPREETILGQRVYRSVAEIPGGVDLVDVFRRAEQIPLVTADVLAAPVPAAWFQLDCVHLASAQRLRDEGRRVVMNRCLMVDHARLLGRGWTVGT